MFISTSEREETVKSGEKTSAMQAPIDNQTIVRKAQRHYKPKGSNLSLYTPCQSSQPTLEKRE